MAPHLHLWCHVGPSLQDGDAGKGNMRMRRQCQQTPGIGIQGMGGAAALLGYTSRGWERTQNSTGVHHGRKSREQATAFIPSTFLKRLPGPSTSLLSANNHETHPVASYPSPQLIYRWVLTVISSFLSLCPRSVWQLKLPQTCL